MTKTTQRIGLALFFAWSYSAFGESVQDPVDHIAQVGKTTGVNINGRTYLKWAVDTNHDGVDDVLLSLKATPDEIKERQDEEGALFDPDDFGFNVYVGMTDGSFSYSNYVEEPEGNVTGGVGVNIARCYCGYIDEVSQYGIVTVETTSTLPDSGHGLPLPRSQVLCYTVQGNHTKRTNLTPLYAVGERNIVYDRYLSDEKRSQVQLQEVTR